MRSTATEFEQRWAEYVHEHYGVWIEPWQFYFDRRRMYVYAGSEFVAHLAAEHDDPSVAIEYAQTIGHMPRGGHGVHVATRSPLGRPGGAVAARQAACDVPGHDPECECGYRQGGRYGGRARDAFRALYVGAYGFDFTGIDEAECPSCGTRVRTTEDAILDHLKGRPLCERQVATVNPGCEA